MCTPPSYLKALATQSANGKSAVTGHPGHSSEGSQTLALAPLKRFLSVDPSRTCNSIVLIVCCDKMSVAYKEKAARLKLIARGGFFISCSIVVLVPLKNFRQQPQALVQPRAG
jgi:hypothetical protein